MLGGGGTVMDGVSGMFHMYMCVVGLAGVREDVRVRIRVCSIVPPSSHSLLHAHVHA